MTRRMFPVLEKLTLWILISFSGCAFSQTNFVVRALPAGEVEIPILFRNAIAPPARYRVIFIPGSDCAGMQPIADRYFRGLLHAEVLVLHKPGIDLLAGPSPKSCSNEFVQWDALSRWADTARVALESDLASRVPLPQVLVGVSEGAEILPLLAGGMYNIGALVLISSSGLDPREAGEMQAYRLGEETAWRELSERVASTERNESLYQGRTLRYWRDMWSWSVTPALLKSNVPVMQIWGSADESIPERAYLKFEALAARESALTNSTGQLCIHRIEAADHGLQSSKRDGLQWLWAQLERWAHAPSGSPCTLKY